MCGACVGCACGVRGVCVGCAWVGCVGAWVGCVRRAWGVRGGVGVGRKERVSLAPLYYPDTLVNPDT